MKRCVYRVAIILIALSFISCAGVGDWTYHELSGDYSVWRINAREIELCQEDSEGLATTIIDAYVSEIAYNDDFIFAKQVPVPEDLEEESDKSNPNYYILDVETGELYVPYTEEEFSDQCNALGIEDSPEWILTTLLSTKTFFKSIINR